MKSPLHILHLEDNPNDAVLIRSALETEGIACVTTRVHTHENFVAALELGGIDLILSDFSMPNFDGLSATAIVRDKWPAIPFIFVSGTLGEKRATEALKSGATDYVLKAELVQLAPAVRRAMHKFEKQAEEETPITAEHRHAMFCLPVDGRWQSEAQLIGQAKLGSRTSRIYRGLANAGFCERKVVPILYGLADVEDFMQMYRATWKMHRAYQKMVSAPDGS